MGLKAAMEAAGCTDWHASSRWDTLAEAEQVVSRFIIPRVIVMGDDGRYWVVSPQSAAKLRKAGYETI